MTIVVSGNRAVIFYCIQRGDATSFAPADDVDPEYGLTLRKAIKVGVEALAYEAKVSEEEVVLTTQIPMA
jgi:sugar fermentation stimulation protein A